MSAEPGRARDSCDSRPDHCHLYREGRAQLSIHSLIQAQNLFSEKKEKKNSFRHKTVPSLALAPEEPDTVKCSAGPRCLRHTDRRTGVRGAARGDDIQKTEHLTVNACSVCMTKEFKKKERHRTAPCGGIFNICPR